MNEADFLNELRAVLDQHTAGAVSTIERLIRSIPPKATALNFVVFPSQDGEGDFTIGATLNGPDLYVLNKAIREHAEIFGVRWTEGGVEPPVPIVDTEDVSFEVNDAVVDCAASWLRAVWNSLGDVDCAIPVSIVADDGYGTITPMNLHPGNVT